MNAAQVNLNPLSQQESGAIPPEHALSALIDGELDVAHLDQLLATVHSETDALANWHSYVVIGDVLRGTGVVTTAQTPGDFLVGIRERLRSEAAPLTLSTSGGLTPIQTSRAEPMRTPAANDSLFRWKLVAGIASLAAVMAVSWSVLSGAPSGAGGAASPQLAAAPAAVESPASAVAAPSTAVVVNTGQGPLIRDARLEELLAEHRQNAGMSALQMPTGFIRNATYDAAGR